MKRQAALKLRKEEDMSYELDDDASSDPSESPQISDSESISDYSRKIRKKRNTYQKISDDIRVKLLEAVQNGDTLKATAKLYNINYSSAKSILHTYRKEGRILKKSVQERNFKKKSGPSHAEQTPKAKRLSKKDTPQKVRQNRKREESVDSPAEDTTVDASSQGEKMYMSPEESEKPETVTPVKTSKRQAQKKEKVEKIISQAEEEIYSHHEENTKKTAPVQENVQAPLTYNQFSEQFYPAVNVDHSNTYYNNHKPYENYYVNYSEPTYGNNARLASYDAGEDNYLNYPNEFDSFNDMMSVLQQRPQKNEGSFLCSREVNVSHLYDEKGHKYEGDCGYDSHFDNSFNFNLKSFMDTQTLFRDTLRRNSFCNNENNSRKRKDSIDFF